MYNKIKLLLSAVILSATMTGINPMPAVPNTVITAKAAAKPALNKKSATLTVGQTFQLKMKNNKKAVKWTSSNKKVASVSGSGLVKAKKNGKATVTAKIGSKKYRCFIKVKTLKIKSIKLQGISSMETDSSARIDASISPSNASNRKLKWKSSNTKVLSVSSNGVLTAKKTGTAVITAAAANGSKKKASRKITIVEKQVPSAGNVSAIPVRPKEEAAIEIHSTEIRKLAPNADESVLHAFEYLGFEVEKNSYGQYSGYFTVKERKIYLKNLSGTTIYHELGHFLAWLDRSRDQKSDFAAVYQKEKSKVNALNKYYITQNSSEYYAESYRDYILAPDKLKAERPSTYAAIQSSLKYLEESGDTYLARVKSAYEQTYWN